MTAQGRKYARGLVVGKFCPLHRGHMLVIDAALAACDEVIVLSYTKPEFDGCGKAVREGWLHALYPRVRALVLEDSLALALPDNDAPDAEQRDFVGWICTALLACPYTQVDSAQESRLHSMSCQGGL